MRAIIRIGLAHVVFLVSWEQSHLMWDGCPIFHSTLTFIHTDALRPLSYCLTPPLSFLRSSFGLPSSFFSATCSLACDPQVPTPLVSFGVFTHVEIVLHMGRDLHAVSSVTATLFSHPFQPAWAYDWYWG